MHVLVCDEHKDLPENEDLLQSYKEKCILQQKVNLPDYSKNIKLTHHVQLTDCSSYKANRRGNHVADSVFEKAIYMLQTIEVDGQQYTLFYDSGCGDFVATYDAIQRIGKKSKKRI